jgi:histidinol-phosphate phosphatase family protein
MKKAVFIDRDGTINYDKGYTYKLSDFKVYEDAVRLIKEYKKKGYLIIIISNQSGIGRGFFTHKNAVDFNEALKKYLRKRGAAIDAVYYCPHKPEDNCNCRKPKPGLIEKALKDFSIDLKKSIAIGDRDDVEGEMARKLGMDYIILKR